MNGKLPVHLSFIRAWLSNLVSLVLVAHRCIQSSPVVLVETCALHLFYFQNKTNGSWKALETFKP